MRFTAQAAVFRCYAIIWFGRLLKFAWCPALALCAILVAQFSRDTPDVFVSVVLNRSACR